MQKPLLPWETKEVFLMVAEAGFEPYDLWVGSLTVKNLKKAENRHGADIFLSNFYFFYCTMSHNVV